VNVIRPLHGKALILEDEKESVSAGGIIIPPTAKDGKFSTVATVVAVGPGKRLKGGGLEEPPVKAGDRIVLAKHHGAEVTYNDKVHRIVSFDVIEGVVETSEA
jgi:chaperonin GroES